MEPSTLSELDPRIRIIVPPPRATKVEHEVASATGAGIGHDRNTDAVAIFTLGVPSEDWNGVVLAVADAQGWSARGDVASAVVVEALEDGLTGWTDHLEFTSHAWQEPVAQAFASAFDHANAKVRALVDGGQPGQGVALTAAALLGNWLCVAHAGDSRVYRLSKNELEQLTADHGRLRLGRNRDKTPAPGPLDDRPVRALGLAAHVTPAVRFFRVKTGDVVLVCSNGLCRHLDGEELARELGTRKPLVAMAQDLVAAAAERGGEDDMSACLARVGRLPAKPLPDPAERADAQPMTETPVLPRYRARAGGGSGARWFAALLGAFVLIAGLAGGFWFWWSTRAPADAVAFADTVRLAQSGSTTPTPAPKGDSIRVMDSGPPPPAAVPPSDTATTSPRTGELVPGDSLEIIQKQISDLRERRRKDSVATEQKKRDDQRVRDSVLAAQETAAAEQRVKDSLAMVAKREDDARQKREAAARAEQEERERREAQLRTEREAADKAAAAETAREEHLAAGRNALAGWMSSIVNNVNAGNVGAPVLAAGPPGFAQFVDKNKPRLSDAKLVATTVNEQTGEATAEWTAKWRSEFGTTTSRRMRATATMVPDGDVWRLRSWRITEGAP